MYDEESGNQIPALSIRQPWAELILSGKKSIEIRSWSANYRGPLWLHTGLKSDPECEKAFGLSNLFKGGYIGCVTLVSIVMMDQERWGKWKEKHLDSGHFRPGLYAWILSSPQRFEHPVQGVGKVNLFYPPDELVVLFPNLTPNSQN
jgi:ASCH domain